MTYEQFWYGEPDMVRAFLKADELNRARRNQEMWLQGLYNYSAVKAVIEAFGWALGGGKGSKPKPYLESPIPITDAEKEEEKKRRIKHTLEWVKAGQK